MKQQTLAAAADQGSGFEQYRRAARRDVSRATMNESVPWQALCEVIKPHYPDRRAWAWGCQNSRPAAICNRSDEISGLFSGASGAKTDDDGNWALNRREVAVRTPADGRYAQASVMNSSAMTQAGGLW
jgi:hypothetical protein